MTDIRKAYSEYLQQYRWDYYATVTFREPRKDPYYAMKAVSGFLWRESGAGRAFLAAEPHKSGDLHIHTIMAQPIKRGYRIYPGMGTPEEVWQGLFDRFGRSKVEPIRGAGDVSDYCSKYVLKGQKVADHYSFLGPAGMWDSSNMVSAPENT